MKLLFVRPLLPLSTILGLLLSGPGALAWPDGNSAGKTPGLVCEKAAQGVSSATKAQTGSALSEKPKESASALAPINWAEINTKDPTPDQVLGWFVTLSGRSSEPLETEGLWKLNQIFAAAQAIEIDFDRDRPDRDSFTVKEKKLIRSVAQSYLRKANVFLEETLPANPKIGFTRSDLLELVKLSVAMLPRHYDNSQRLFYHRLFSGLFALRPSRLSDLYMLYNRVGIRPNPNEASEMIQLTIQKWKKAFDQDLPYGELAYLTRIVDGIPPNMLAAIVKRFTLALSHQDPSALQQYFDVAWDLLLENPRMAYDFMQNVPLISDAIRPYDPRAIGSDEAAKQELLRSTLLKLRQINNLTAYFTSVMKLPPVAWLEKAKRRLNSNIPRSAVQDNLTTTTTSSQTKFAQMLLSEFPTAHFQEEYPIPNTGYVADFFSADLNWIIEIDGEAHFIYNEKNEAFQRSRDIIRNQILAALGYEVIHLKNRESDSIFEQHMRAKAGAKSED